MKPLLRALPWAAALAAMWTVKATLGLFVVNLLLIYVMVAVGLNLLMGFTGQISAGHAGFLAVGAYVAAILGKVAPGLGLVGALGAAGLVTAVVGLLIGLPALRLTGFYVAMATLAFGVVVAEAILQLKAWTGGADGLYVSVPSLFGLTLASDERKFWVVLAAAVLTVATAASLSRSKVGRAFLALKESPVAAEAMGIHTALYRTLAFVLSAFYTGVAGGLFAYVVGYVSPDAFSLEMSIDFAAMVIIGGMGSIWGSILGAAFLTALNQSLASLQDARALVFGMAVVLSMIFMP
ncbi:MAG: branched-chain amino acid ABC transporter permease, partial [Deltaproteobacteria bacterium]|nr:branched-chain amino acid ABC transporter permease [Deltaproteobacteria bacterium]